MPRRLFPGGGVVFQDSDQSVPYLLLQILRHRFEEAPGTVDVRRNFVQYFQIATQLRQDHQHRRDIGVGQRRSQGCLIANGGFEYVAHRCVPAFSRPPCIHAQTFDQRILRLQAGSRMQLGRNSVV